MIIHSVISLDGLIYEVTSGICKNGDKKGDKLIQGIPVKYPSTIPLSLSKYNVIFQSFQRNLNLLESNFADKNVLLQ